MSLNILHTPPRFYPSVGGVEEYVCTLGKGLVRKGHVVSIICANDPKDRKMTYVHHIMIKRLFSIGKIANTNITPSLPLALSVGDHDIIHTHLPTPWSADWSAIISKTRRIPLILTYHNDISGAGIYRLFADLYNKTLLKFLLKTAKFIIITNPRFKSRHLVPYLDKVIVIPNSVDTTVFKPVPEPKRGDILFIGVLDKFHHYKGLDNLISAVRLLKQSNPSIKLIIGGTGTEIGYFKNLTEMMGISENVSFMGHVLREDLVRLYNSCTIFVLPSTDPTREGFGIVLLEAMACGRPVITTDITGVAEDVRNFRSGICVEPGNVEDLAKAINQILPDENLANQMGMAGRTLVEEKYSSEVVANQIEHVYLSVLSLE
jgi:glycosyltransferase involved in cell wall biosynthesis